MDISKDLINNKTTLVLVSSVEYSNFIVNLAKQVSGKSVCYVTLSKTYPSIKEVFEKNKVVIKDFVFIDAISKTIRKSEDQADGCYFVSSPGALTELSLVISKFIHHNFDYLIFDSVTNLVTYRKPAVVEKFMNSIVTKVKASKIKGIFLALDIEEQKGLIGKVSTFVDKTVKM